MARAGDLVRLSGPQAYQGCIGVVMQEHQGGMREVLLPGFGTVVRRSTDLSVVTGDEEAALALECPTPEGWLADLKRSSAMKAMMRAIALGRDDEAAMYAAEAIGEEAYIE